MVEECEAIAQALTRLRPVADEIDPADGKGAARTRGGFFRSAFSHRLYAEAGGRHAV